MTAHLHLARAHAEDTPTDPSAGPIRVMVAADHALLRRGLRQLLDLEADVTVVGEASEQSAIVGQAQSERPHVLVLDRGMSEDSSVAAIGELSARAPQTQVVVLASKDRPVFLQRTLAAGALGLVAKDHAEEELPQAVRAVARGERYVSQRLAGGLDTLQRSLSEDKLTQRETEVLSLIALGHTSVEIARKLHVSPRTIETHRAHIHKKLALETRAELVRYALRRGLLGA